MSGYPPDDARRIVTPRAGRRREVRPVLAVTGEGILSELFPGELFDASELPSILAASPSSIIAAQGFGTHLLRLQRHFESDPHFNYRLTPLERYGRHWQSSDGKRHQCDHTLVDSICNFVGWRKHDRSPAKYHYPLDPIWYLSLSIEELYPSGDSRLARLYRWGMQVRDWAASEGLIVKASAGGMAAQLLRDSRFYPEPRRKVPRLINDIARFRLPGNYYRFHGEIGKRYDAICFDMENAHHWAASHLRFPDANSLHAYGDWDFEPRYTRTEGKTSPRPFAPGDSPLLERPGLFHVRISVPHIRAASFPLPYLETMGERDVYLYSNELETLREFGVRILRVYAAYCSEGAETGLNRYAEYAIEQIRSNPNMKPWLKPTLHATYGVLAARPSRFETGFYRVEHETNLERREYHMGNVSLPVWVKAKRGEIESRLASVIHRGMIEAEVRKQSLWFARFLAESDRLSVLAIYADAVFVDDPNARFRHWMEGKRDDYQLKVMPPPWRVKAFIPSIRFHSPTHFTSPSISRLPGIPRNAQERYRRALQDAAHLRERGPSASGWAKDRAYRRAERAHIEKSRK